LGLPDVQKDARVLHHTALLGKELQKVGSLGSGLVMLAASAIGTATKSVAAMARWVARHPALEEEGREAAMARSIS